MSDIHFMVDNENFTIHHNFFEFDSFVIQSVAHSYSVTWNANIVSCIDKILYLLQKDKHNFLLIDNNIKRLYFYGKCLPEAQVYAIDALEDNKNIHVVLQLIERMYSIGFEKNNVLLVVGGGITQDIGAFAGCIFKRGISWEFYPTTLLSMCDSCIGGKTGINFHGIKNQLALFSAPKCITICPEFLSSLSMNEFRSGLGEILKLSVTGGKELVELYASFNLDGKNIPSIEKLKKLIWIALMVKKVIIEKDEFDNLYRHSLNYGHTLGHAIEVMSHNNIPHGQAVALGMIAVNKMSSDLGLLSPEENALLKFLANPLYDHALAKQLDFSLLENLLLNDKKTEKNDFVFVFVTSFGNTIFYKYPKNKATIEIIIDAIRSVIE